MEMHHKTKYILYSSLVALIAICLFQGWIIFRDHKSPAADKASFMDPQKFSTMLDNSFKKDQQKTRTMFDRFFDKDFFNKSSDPFKLMENMQHNMAGMMGDQSRQMFNNSWKDWFSDRFPSTADTISMNTKEKDNEYVITVRVPNLKDDQLKIDLNSDGLSVHGNYSKTVERKDDQGNVVGRYETNQTLSRTVPIPDGVDIDQAKIDHQKDSVIIHLPKVKPSNLPHFGS